MSLMMIIMPLCMAAISPVSGAISDKVGAIRVMPVAFLTMLTAAVCLVFLSESSSFWHIGIGVGLVGIAYGLSSAPINSEIINTAGVEYSGYAGGFVSLFGIYVSLRLRRADLRPSKSK